MSAVCLPARGLPPEFQAMRQTRRKPFPKYSTYGSPPWSVPSWPTAARSFPRDPGSMRSYSNLILWRNNFAHVGNVPATATYAEVTQSYEDGKFVIHALAASMVR